MTPLMRRRWMLFKQNKRAFWALWVFLFIFVASLFAEVIANDKPLIVKYKGNFYFPILTAYTDTFFGGDLPTEADYKDPFTVAQINQNGWMIMPPVAFSYDTIQYELTEPAPAPPSRQNWLGTDDLARDLLARLIYGIRTSLLFGLILTFFSSLIGILFGSVQGYFAGKVDLIFQRVLEIWGSLPQLFILIIVSSLLLPSFGTLLVVLLLFSWTSLVGVVRAEFLRVRNFDYVKAAKALGVSDKRIMLRHILPNALVSALTFIPFILSGAVVALTALDFLGFGLPPGEPSLGELVRQGKENLNAPWIGLSAFVVLSVLLSCLIFVGEGIRDAFDPRKEIRHHEKATITPLASVPSKQVLSVQNLSISFAGKEVVHGVSFQIEKGQTVALVGSSGSGKSVTALSILGILQNASVKGSIQLNGQELVGLSEREMRSIRGRKIGLVFQEPMTSLNPLHRVGNQVKEVLQIHFKKASNREVVRLFHLVGLKNAARKIKAFPHELSGGERQRVMIAMALAGQPDLLIADEPTTALDVTIQKQILDLLKDLQKRLQLSILFISHDRAVVHYIADTVYEMKNGFLSSGQKRLPPLAKRGLPKPLGKPVLTAKEVCVSYGSFKALWPLSLTLYEGRTLGVVGESGSGKTTLANALLGLIKYEGSVSLIGEDSRAFRAKVQVVFQDPFSSLNPRMSVEQIIQEGLFVHAPKMSASARQAAVQEILTEVGLPPEIKDRYPHELSGGERQRVAISRALILKPKVLILDEPTSALDVENRIKILALLKKLQAKYQLSYLFISHDMYVVNEISDDLLVLRQGKVVETGPLAQVFMQPKEAYTQELIQSAFLS